MHLPDGVLVQSHTSPCSPFQHMGCKPTEMKGCSRNVLHIIISNNKYIHFDRTLVESQGPADLSPVFFAM